MRVSRAGEDRILSSRPVGWIGIADGVMVYTCRAISRGVCVKGDGTDIPCIAIKRKYSTIRGLKVGEFNLVPIDHHG